MPWPALPDVGFGQAVAVHPSQLIESVLHRDLGEITGTGHVTAAYKTVDESVVSSTSLQNDDHLRFDVGASQIWVWECALFVSGSTVGDLQIAFTVPTGATLNWHYHALAAAAAGPTGDLVSDGSTISGGAAANPVGVNTSQSLVIIKGYVSVGSTAGTVQLQWAQSTADATATQVRIGSHLIARRIA